MVDTPVAPVILSAINTPSLGRTVVSIQAMDNLLTANQASLETNTTGWSAGPNASIARSTAQFLNGVASLAVTCTSAASIYYTTPVGNRPTVTPKQVYTAVVSHKATSVARAFYINLDWFNSGGTYLYSSTGPTFADNPSGWQQAWVTAQAPDTAATVAITVTIVSAATSEVHYVDAISIFPNPYGNLISNPDFEDVTTGWTVGSSWTGSLSTAQSYAGRRSLLLTRNTSTVGNGYVFTALPVISGLTYALSWWVRPSTATAFNIQASGATPTGYTTTVLTANTWQKMSYSFTATSTGTVNLWLTDDSNGSPTNGSTIHLDAAQLVIGTTTPTWNPPSTTNLSVNPSFELNTAWVGTDSPSAFITRDVTKAYTLAGIASARVEAGVSGTYLNIYTNDENVRVEVGVNYTGSLYVNPDIDRTIRGGMSWYGPSIGYVSGPVGSTIFCPAGQWTRLSSTGVAPAGAIQGLVYAADETPYSAGYGYNIDACQLEAGSVATPYVDGALGAGYEWESSVGGNILPAAAASFEDGSTGGYGTGMTGPTNTTYCLSAWFRASATVNAFLTDDGTLTSVPSSAVFNVVANTWTRLFWIFTTGSDVTGTYILRTSAAAATGTQFWLDAVMLEQRNHPTAYESGTANYTTSRRQTPWTPGGLVTGSGILTLERADNNPATTAYTQIASLAIPTSQAVTYTDEEAPPGSTVYYRARVMM